MSERKLTVKESNFVDQYIILNGNGAKAALEAGYSQKSARQLASRLLKKKKIQDAIAECRRALAEKVEQDKEWLIAKMKRAIEISSMEIPVTDGNGVQKTGTRRIGDAVFEEPAVKLVDAGSFKDLSIGLARMVGWLDGPADGDDAADTLRRILSGVDGSNVGIPQGVVEAQKKIAERKALPAPAREGDAAADLNDVPPEGNA